MRLLGRRPAADDAVPVEQRESPRFSLIMRVAKLLCESGEYACIVRDISATGTKIRLFHDVPPDEHLYLELANGRRYAMQRVWEDGNHAGYRFSCVIEVDEFVEETSLYPRRPVRLRLQRPCLVTADGRDWRGVLVNMSQQGACIEASGELALRQLVRVELPGLPLRFGHVCWRKGHAHGVVFQNALRLDELARHALALQPYAAAAIDDAATARYA